MNKTVKFIVCVSFGLMAALPITQAAATPIGVIDVEGFVNPVNAIVIDNGDGTSTFDNLRYHFNTVAVNNSEVAYLQVGFVSDIFDLSGYSLAGTLWLMRPSHTK